MKYKNYKCKRLSRKHFDDIIIREAFRQHPPKQWKMDEKLDNFYYCRKLSPIIVDENNILVDGYCTYLICRSHLYRGHKLKIYKAKGLDINKKERGKRSQLSLM